MNAYDILGGKVKKQRKGGAHEEEKKEQVKDVKKDKSYNMTIEMATPNSVMEKYDPIITRPTMSINEYVRAHTQLAEFINTNKSVKNFIKDVEIKCLSNPSEIAFYLLKEGKCDITIDRGYEKVSYSRLKINPQWESMSEHYFKQQHETQLKEVFEPLELV